MDGKGEARLQPDDRPGPCCAVWISRSCLVLTSCPAACQEPGSTRSIEVLVRSAGQDPFDDLRLDLGGTAEPRRIPDASKADLAQASSADDGT